MHCLSFILARLLRAQCKSETKEEAHTHKKKPNEEVALDFIQTINQERMTLTRFINIHKIVNSIMLI